MTPLEPEIAEPAPDGCQQANGAVKADLWPPVVVVGATIVDMHVRTRIDEEFKVSELVSSCSDTLFGLD